MVNDKTPTTSNSTTPQPTGQGTPGAAIAALILGILAFISGVFFIGGLLGIIAVILGIIGIKQPGGKGMSVAGIILGILGILGTIATIVLTVIGINFFNEAAKETTKSLDDYSTTQQEAYDEKAGSKRDFAKGETAQFGDFEVSVNKLTRNYVPENRFMRAKEGKELVVVDLTLKNISDKSQYIISAGINIEDNGLIITRNYATPPGRALDTSGQLTSGGSTNGQLVYEVTKGAKDLRLISEASAYNPKIGQSEKIKYTLAL